MTDAARYEVVVIDAAATHPLRRTVLRDGFVDPVLTFDGDDDADTVHLGLRDGEQLVAVSTWMRRDHRGRPAVQLRGMATATDRQGSGLGGILLHAGFDHARRLGVELVWANARDAALAFYLRHGFEVVGDGFVDATTQLPHHVVVRATG